jgi:PA14 domain
VNPSGPANQAPTVNAGADQTITMPTSANLIGTAIDDGLPNPPAALTTTWSKLSGPGTVTFATANALSTTASFSASGAYVLRLTASDGALASADDVSVTVNAAPGTTGSGLTGQYYNDPGTGAHFVTLVLTRTDPTVNFNWGTASPGPGVTAERFSVRWTGQVLAPVTGNYTFTTVSDDGVRLWVNGQLVINNWTNHAATTNNSAPIALTAGTKYAIRMEFYDQTSAAVARLLWAYPGQAQIVIPQSRLFP